MTPVPPPGPIAPRPAPRARAAAPAGGGGPEVPSFGAKPVSVTEAVAASKGLEAAATAGRSKKLEATGKRVAELRKSAEDPSRTARDVVAEAARGQAAPLESFETDFLQTQLTSTETGRPPAIVDTVRNFNTYTSIQQQIESGVRPEDAFKAAGIGRPQFEALRKDVLGNMAQMQIVRELMPEIHSLTPDQQADFMETFLANNGTVRREMMSRVRDVLVKAEGMPAGPKKPDARAAATPDAKPQLEAARDATIARMRQQLENAGFTLDDAAAAKIQTLYDGRHTDRITADAFDIILQQNGIGAPAQARRYAELSGEPATIDAQIAGVRTQIDSLNGALGDRTERLAELRGQQTTLERKRDLVNQQLANIRAQNPNADTELATYQAVAEQVYGRKAPDGSVVPGIKDDLSQLGQQLDGIKKIDLAPASPTASSELSPEQARQAQERMRVQGELTRDLENALTESIRSGIDEMVENATAMQDRHLEAARLKAEQEGNERAQQAVDAITKGRSRYREWDEGKRRHTVHRGAIGEDMRYLAGSGEDGVRRIIVRDLQEQGIIQFQGADGAALNGDWKTVDISKLKDAALIDQMYAEHGDTVSSRLFTEYIGARRRRDMHVLGQDLGALALTDGEYGSLEEHFRGKFDAAVKDNADHKKALAQLQARGVNLNSSTGAFMKMLCFAGLPLTKMFGDD